MTTRDEIRAQHQQCDRRLVRTMERMRLELRLTSEDWSDCLRVKPVEYERIIQGRSSLSAASVYYLTERFNLDPQAIERGEINYAALVQAHLGNRSYISPEYRVAASSRKFTVINTLSYVERSRGTHLRVATNRRFQVYEDLWTDWERPDSERINIQMLSKMWSFLRQRGLEDEDFRAIGFQTTHTHRRTHIGRMFSSFLLPEQVYECLFSDFVENFEQNHLYRIKRLNGKVCIVESRSNPDVADALKVLETGSAEGCQVKIGLMRSLPNFVGKSAAAVHETSCIHKGDEVCRFFCDFSDVKPTGGFGRRLSLLN